MECHGISKECHRMLDIYGMEYNRIYEGYPCNANSRECLWKNILSIMASHGISMEYHGRSWATYGSSMLLME